MQYVAYDPLNSNERASEIMRKPFSEVNSVLNRVMSKLGLDKRLREHTFLTLWPTFVSGAIADRSRPLFIDAERNLVVSVADAATGQELSMSKPRVMAKIGPAARSLGIDLSGIRVDLKHYHSASTSVAHPLASDNRLPAPSEEDLAAVALSEEDLRQISNLGEELTGQGADSHTKERMLRLFEREFRIRHWRIEHGYPQCSGCGNPVERLHKLPIADEYGDFPMVCIACLYANS